MEKKFVIDQKSLLNILSSMQPICTKKTPLDATNCIYFQVGHKEIVLKSSDLEISLQASCTLKESSIDETYSFLVPGKRIFEVVKELDGDIIFIISKHQLIIQADQVNLSLNIKEASEFPPFPEMIENLMPLDAKHFLKMLDSVAFLIPQNNATSALNGLYLEISDANMKMTTTDGHCLAQVSTDKTVFNNAKAWLMPRRAIYELKKILETSQDVTIFLGTCSNQLVFSGELFNFFTKLLAEQFPHYQSILDKTAFKPALIDRSKFLKTLKRSTCLLSGQFIATKFDFENTNVRVSMQNKEVGTLDEVLALSQFTECNLNIRFYAPYLLSGLQAFGEDTVTLYLKNSTNPIIFESNEDDFKVTYLVMPVSPASNNI